MAGSGTKSSNGSSFRNSSTSSSSRAISDAEAAMFF